MPWQVKLNEQHPIVEQILEGEIDDDETRLCMDETVRLGMLSERPLILVDANRYQWPDFSPQKYITLAHQDALGITELANYFISSCKAAYVTQPEVRENKFLEVWNYLLAIRGVKTQIFTDREQAIGWLLQQN